MRAQWHKFFNNEPPPKCEQLSMKSPTFPSTSVLFEETGHTLIFLFLKQYRLLLTPVQGAIIALRLIAQTKCIGNDERLPLKNNGIFFKNNSIKQWPWLNDGFFPQFFYCFQLSKDISNWIFKMPHLVLPEWIEIKRKIYSLG